MRAKVDFKVKEIRKGDASQTLEYLLPESQVFQTNLFTNKHVSI